jgi:hypothetical protein
MQSAQFLCAVVHSLDPPERVLIQVDMKTIHYGKTRRRSITMRRGIVANATMTRGDRYEYNGKQDT